jgi:hypothetical protein
MMYTEREVMTIASQMVRLRGVNGKYLDTQVRQIMARKRRKPLTAHDAALIAVERCATTDRRLGHDTGAENWY